MAAPLSPYEIAKINSEHWPLSRKDKLVLSVAIVLGESEGDPAAHNYNPATGDDSWGMWQVNYHANLRPTRTRLYGPPHSQFDPIHNAACAYDIYLEAGQSFTPWGAFTSNGYRKYHRLERAAAGVNQLEREQKESPPLPSSWHLAPSLDKLRSEANEAAPNRSTTSDGTIGDAAHASRPSDHNPDADDKSVNALDLTHDPVHGWDCHDRVALLVKSQDKRIAYIIWNGQIWRSYKTRDSHPAPWTPEAYLGSNPHTKHMHVSILHGPVPESDLSAWFPRHPLDWLTMATKEDVKDAVREVLSEPANHFPEGSVLREIWKAGYEEIKTPDGKTVRVEATDQLRDAINKQASASTPANP